MTIPDGILLAYPGDEIDFVGLGWERNNTLNGKFLRGNSTAGGTGGGSHTHAVASHSHSVSHSHGSAGGSVTSNTSALDGNGIGGDIAFGSHTHVVTFRNDSRASTTAAAQTSGTGTVLPAHTEVIWAESSEADDILEGFVAFWPRGVDVPDNWKAYNPTGGFLRGAATSADPTGAVAASNHSHTAAAHTHSLPHTHEVSTSSPSNGWNGGTAGTDAFARSGHTHARKDSSSHTSTLASSGSNSVAGSLTPEPPWNGITMIERVTEDGNIPVGLIAGWTGSAVTIPAGWVACNGLNGTPDLNNGRLIKDSTSSGGGSALHTHTGAIHSHAIDAHTHTSGTIGGAAVTAISDSTGTGDEGATTTHTHPSETSGAVSGGGSITGVGLNFQSASSFPAYYDVIFIQQLATVKTDTENLPVNVVETQTVAKTDLKTQTDTYTLALVETELAAAIETVSDTDTYTVGVSEAEAVIDTTFKTDTDTYTIGVDEDETRVDEQIWGRSPPAGQGMYRPMRPPAGGSARA